MSTCSFILSTGRVSTQNIAVIATKAYPNAVIEHEGLGFKYFPRKVFRRPKQFATALGHNVLLQRKLIEIEDTISEGRSYLDVGWPTYAWIPYLVDRFDGKIRFVHLVRNPFHVAASLTTLGLFTPNIQRVRRWVRFAMVHPKGNQINYPELAAAAEEFSPFELNLFHWLELNTFMIEQHYSDGFVGIFRFEELYKGETPTLPFLLEKLVGKGDFDLNMKPLDSGHRKLPSKIPEPNPDLVKEVTKIAMLLGYSENELDASRNLDLLNKRYSSKRL